MTHQQPNNNKIMDSTINRLNAMSIDDREYRFQNSKAKPSAEREEQEARAKWLASSTLSEEQLKKRKILVPKRRTAHGMGGFHKPTSPDKPSPAMQAMWNQSFAAQTHPPVSAPRTTIPFPPSSEPSNFADEDEPARGEIWSDVFGNEVEIKTNGIAPYFHGPKGRNYVWDFLHHVWRDVIGDYNVPGMLCRVKRAPLIDYESSDSQLSEDEDESDSDDEPEGGHNMPRAGEVWIYENPDNNDEEGVEQQFVVEWDRERKQWVFYDDEKLRWWNVEKEYCYDEDDFEADEIEYIKKADGMEEDMDVDMDVDMEM